MVERAGGEAGLKFGVHPHMLRHACGYSLANAGHDTRLLQAYVGHRNIQHTVRYSPRCAYSCRRAWAKRSPRSRGYINRDICYRM
jgi:site-specific recombinase XerD